MSQINNRQRNNVAQNEDLKQKFLCFEFRSWYTSKTQLFLKWELLWSWSFWWVFNILKSDPVAAAIIGARQRWSKQKKTISGFNWKATHNCESHMATRAEKRQPIVCWIWNQPILPSFSQTRAKWRLLQLLIFRHQHHCSRGRCILFTHGHSSIFRLAWTIEFAESVRTWF